MKLFCKRFGICRAISIQHIQIVAQAAFANGATRPSSPPDDSCDSGSFC